MCNNSRDSISVTPTIKGVYGEIHNPTLEACTSIFVPLISIDTAHNTDKCNYLGNLDCEVLPLSHFDMTETPVETVKFTIKTTFRLKVEKGNKNADLEEGRIVGTSNQVRMVRVIHNGVASACTQKGDNSSEFGIEKVKYGDTFEVEVEPYELYENSYSDAYILFKYYNDEFKLADCGKVRVTNTSKVGKRLIINIRNLPTTRILLDRDASFKISVEKANLSQSPGGLCYAITMGRANKAFSDLFRKDVLKLDTTNSDDARYSGTTTPSIPDNLFGYGVGAALVKNGHAKLLSIDEIIEGKLEEGAIIQYWANLNNVSWGKLKSAIKFYTISKHSPERRNYSYGHSIIFKTYLYSSKGDIIGFKYCDQWQFDRTAHLTDGEFYVYNRNEKVKAYILGVNLIDIE